MSTRIRAHSKLANISSDYMSACVRFTEQVSKQSSNEVCVYFRHWIEIYTHIHTMGTGNETFNNELKRRWKCNTSGQSSEDALQWIDG